MMKNNVQTIDFSNTVNSTSAFLTIAVMVLSYSITKGIGVGMIAYTLMSIVSYIIELVRYAVTKQNKPTLQVSVISIIISLLFCIYFFVPVVL